MTRITHRLGEMETVPAESVQLARLLDELDTDDPEHAEVAVACWVDATEQDWSLSLSTDGRGYRAVWEEVESGTQPPRHLKELSRDRALRLMHAVAAGDLDAVEREPWRPGYGGTRNDAG